MAMLPSAVFRPHIYLLIIVLRSPCLHRCAMACPQFIVPPRTDSSRSQSSSMLPRIYIIHTGPGPDFFFILLFYINPFRFLSLGVVTVTTVYSLSFCAHPPAYSTTFLRTQFLLVGFNLDFGWNLLSLLLIVPSTLFFPSFCSRIPAPHSFKC